MNERDANGASVLAWTIPPTVDPERERSVAEPEAEIRRLADELEVVCQPESVTLKMLSPGVSRIHLRFADRESAFRALDTARGRARAHPDAVCRIVATTVVPGDEAES